MESGHCTEPLSLLRPDGVAVTLASQLTYSKFCGSIPGSRHDCCCVIEQIMLKVGELQECRIQRAIQTQGTNRGGMVWILDTTGDPESQGVRL